MLFEGKFYNINFKNTDLSFLIKILCLLYPTQKWLIDFGWFVCRSGVLTQGFATQEWLLWSNSCSLQSHFENSYGAIRLNYCKGRSRDQRKSWEQLFPVHPSPLLLCALGADIYG
jgi:hypothetical protein